LPILFGYQQYDKTSEEKMSKKAVMTLKEAAEYLNVHCDTLRRRAKNGTIPAFKIGTDWRFNQSSLENWIKEMEEAHKNSVHKKT
jgi:excisionase family DNA binding protein